MSFKSFFAILTIALLTHTVTAQKNEEIALGTPEALEMLDMRGSVSADVEIQVDPSYHYDKADHVANGIAMRNRTSGTIHLRGVPAGARVIQSLLYWNFSDNFQSGPDTMPVLFDGNLIISRKTADNPDPCWGKTGNHTYVADVTAFTDTSGSPNQDYQVVLVFDEVTVTNGINPWPPAIPAADVLAEGATLIVVYQDEKTSGPLAIYDKLSGTTFSSSFNATLTNPAPLNPAIPDLFTMVGADGQLGSNGYNVGSSNELTFFNGIQIAGPPVTNSDWDGSDGWPLVQLWDTHTHEVELKGPTSRLTYNAGADCLTPVAFVLDDK